MKIARSLSLAAIVLSLASLHGQQSPQLKATLEKLNESSAHFTSAQASFKKDLFTKIINDHEDQDGITYTIRHGGASEVGIKIEGKGARTVEYKNGTARDYNPALKCYDTYSAAKSKSTIESLLALSFGASGTELEKNWTITDLGAETLTSDNKPVHVEKLSLVPKEQGLRNNITKVELWTDVSSAVAYKEIVYAPTGDTQTAVYSHVVLNKMPVDTKAFKIDGKPCGK